jgi:hypothetical protein
MHLRPAYEGPPGVRWLFASVVLVEQFRSRLKVVCIKRRKQLIQDVAHGVPHLPAE